MAFTRFRMPWEWDGSEVQIMSRAMDESGYVQPSREELTEARGSKFQLSLQRNQGVENCG